MEKIIKKEGTAKVATKKLPAVNMQSVLGHLATYALSNVDPVAGRKSLSWLKQNRKHVMNNVFNSLDRTDEQKLEAIYEIT